MSDEGRCTLRGGCQCPNGEMRTCPNFKIEAVDHPLHYGGAGNPYEVIKVLEAWLTPEEFRGFLKGNVIKYNARAKAKGGDQDYAKAAWYMNYMDNYNERLAERAK